MLSANNEPYECSNSSSVFEEAKTLSTYNIIFQSVSSLKTNTTAKKNNALQEKHAHTSETLMGDAWRAPEKTRPPRQLLPKVVGQDLQGRLLKELGGGRSWGQRSGGFLRRFVVCFSFFLCDEATISRIKNIQVK